MAAFDTLRRDFRAIQIPGLRLIKRRLKRLLPTRLYTRSVMIVIIPMLLLQSVVAAVFMERHWQLVTERLSSAVTRDIAAIIELLQTDPEEDDYQRVIRIPATSWV